MEGARPCGTLTGRRRDICEGTAAGISKSVRRQYVDLWLSNGTLTADPDTPTPVVPPRITERKPKPPEPFRELPCVHIGPQLGTIHCAACQSGTGKSGPIARFACDKYTECTVSKTGKPLKGCSSCGSYEAEVPVISWACGVTAAPRMNPTVVETLSSVRAAGWEPVVFAEPKTKLDGITGSVSVRPETLGPWRNWLASARDLLRRFPYATRFVLFQDDVEVWGKARERVDAYGWPANVGCLSLYTSFVYHKSRSGIHELTTDNFFGACALAFKRQVLQQVVNHELAETWRGLNDNHPKNGIKNIDTVIGKILHSLGLKIHGWSPSLCRHTGKESSIWKTAEAVGERQVKAWMGDP